MAPEAASKSGYRAGAKGGLWGWINRRLPVDAFLRASAVDYYAPKNFNIWYYFGSLALLALVMQLLTGIFLTMFYKVGAATSFDSVSSCITSAARMVPSTPAIPLRVATESSIARLANPSIGSTLTIQLASTSTTHLPGASSVPLRPTSG